MYIQVSPMMPSLELLSNDSVIPTSEVEPSKTADNISSEPTISDNSEDATMSATVPVRCYSIQARKSLERY